jgi:putative hydrolase of the HAD superfamily
MWAEEFAEQPRLEQDSVDWLISLDQESVPHREVFFGRVRDRFGLSDPVEELWGAYRRRMPYLVHCRP